MFRIFLHVFIGLKSLKEIAQQILGFLSYDDLKSAELASPVWREAISLGNLWKRLLNNKVDPYMHHNHQIIHESKVIFCSNLDQIESTVEADVWHP